MRLLIHRAKVAGGGATSAKGYFMVLELLARYVPLAAHMLHQQKAVVGTIACCTMYLQIHHARVTGGGATNVRGCSTADMLNLRVVWLAVRMRQQQRVVAGTIAS
ncbi:MAG: hypothetical protein OEW13_00090 [Nitrospira sp.]|nr:hypothetical protein [Nitrospira sp.]